VFWDVVAGRAAARAVAGKGGGVVAQAAARGAAGGTTGVVTSPFAETPEQLAAGAVGGLVLGGGIGAGVGKLSTVLRPRPRVTGDVGAAPPKLGKRPTKVTFPGEDVATPLFPPQRIKGQSVARPQPLPSKIAPLAAKPAKGPQFVKTGSPDERGKFVYKVLVGGEEIGSVGPTWRAKGGWGWEHGQDASFFKTRAEAAKALVGRHEFRKKAAAKPAKPVAVEIAVTRKDGTIEMLKVSAGQIRRIQEGKGAPPMLGDLSNTATYPVRSVPTEGVGPQVSDVVKQINKAFGSTVITLKQPGRVLGHFNPRTGATTVGNPANIPTTIHEAAHHLDWAMKLSEKIMKTAWRGRAEFLSGRYDNTIPGGVERMGKWGVIIAGMERFSQLMRSWVLHPDGTKAIHPHLVKRLEGLLGDSLPEWQEASRLVAEFFGTDPKYKGSRHTGMPSSFKERGTIIDWLLGRKEHFDTSRMPWGASDFWHEHFVSNLRALVAVPRFFEKISNRRLKDSADPLARYYEHRSYKENIRKMADSDGLRDSRGKLVKDPVTGEHLTAKWSLEELTKLARLPGWTLEKATRAIDSYLISTRGRSLRGKITKELQEELEKEVEKQVGKIVAQLASKGVTITPGDVAMQRLLVRAKLVASGKYSPPEVVTGATGGLESEVKAEADAIAAVFNANPEEKKLILEAARRYRLLQNAALERAVNAGLISVEKYMEFVERGDYTNLTRFIEESPGGPPLRDFITSKPLAPAGASGRRIMSPISTMWNSVEAIERSASYNHIERAFAKMAEVVDPKVSMGEKREFHRIGIHFEGKPTGVEAETARVYYDHGKAKYWRPDPKIAETLELIKWGDPHVRRWLQLPRKVLTFTVTRMASFAFGQFPKEGMDILVKSMDPKVIPRDPFLALKLIFKRKDIREYLARGGSQFSFYGEGGPIAWEVYTAEKIREMMAQGHFVFSPVKWKKIGRAYQRFLQDFSENSNKGAEYWRARKRAIEELGYDERQAHYFALKASFATQDLAMTGASLRELGQIIAFFRANVAGTYSGLAATFLRGKQSRVVWARLALVSGALLALEELWNEQTGSIKDLRKLPPWRRDLFVNLAVGNGKWLLLPVGWLTGFWRAMARRGLEITEAGGDLSKADWPGLSETAQRNFVPFGNIGEMAGPVHVVDQLTHNYRDFTDGPIVPPWELDQSLEERNYQERSSRAAQWATRVGHKFFGEHVAMDDPRQYDFLAPQLLGIMGRDVTRLSDVLPFPDPDLPGIDPKESGKTRQERVPFKGEGIGPLMMNLTGIATNLLKDTPNTTANISRAIGKAKEARLWKKFGGPLQMARQDVFEAQTPDEKRRALDIADAAALRLEQRVAEKVARDKE
jgi:hypothetical protein